MTLPIDYLERRGNNSPTPLESGVPELDNWADHVLAPPFAFQFFLVDNSRRAVDLYGKLPSGRRDELKPRWRAVLAEFALKANTFSATANYNSLSVFGRRFPDHLQLFWSQDDNLLSHHFQNRRNDFPGGFGLSNHIVDLTGQVNEPEWHALEANNPGLQTALHQYLDAFLGRYIDSFGEKRDQLINAEKVAKNPEDPSWGSVAIKIPGFKIIASELVLVVESKVPYNTIALAGEMDGYLHVLKKLCLSYAATFNTQQAKKDAQLANSGNLTIPQATIGVVNENESGVAGFKKIEFRFGIRLYGLGKHGASLASRVEELTDFLSSPDWQEKSRQFPEQNQSIRQYLAALQAYTPGILPRR